MPSFSPDAIRARVVRAAERDEALKPFASIVEAAERGIAADSEEAKALFEALHPVPQDGTPALPKIRPFDGIPDAKELGISIVPKAPFSNWGQTVQYQPDYTLVVTKIEGVCAVVQWASRLGKRIRAAGFRHSWSDIFGTNGDVLIMFLPYDTLTQIPYNAPSEGFMKASELLGISLVESVAGRKASDGKAFCKVMAGTTNGEFRQWCLVNKKYCIPFNVIMEEVTFGGTNAPICHGAGFSSTTLSDLVVELEYVDASGKRQTINDPVKLRVASGAFGLLGIVISLTIQLDPMGVAEMMPVKTFLPLAIPPPPGYTIPEIILDEMKSRGIGDNDLEKARALFKQRCENDFYLEWFWFPYMTDCWVNTWKKRPIGPEDTDLQPYPSPSGFNGTVGQALQETFAQTLTSAKWFGDWNGVTQSFLLGTGAMLALPDISNPSEAIKTYSSEALHFRRGIQNFRCWDMEWEIGIPANKEGTRDYDAISRAWWDAITEIYADPKAPCRLTLEMRLTGGSAVTLAPMRGHDLGTVSIEVLTTRVTPEDLWQHFCQTLTDKWTGNCDFNGKLLDCKPHWAKQWKWLSVRGQPIDAYLQDVYGEAFAEFRAGFKEIVEGSGGSVQDTLARFGDPTMKRLIFGA